MTRVLITGAAGFIGSHLAERLTELGHDVLGIDDFSGAGSARGFLPYSEFHLGTVADRLPYLMSDGPSHLAAKPFDTVYHLAAKIGVGTILADPLAMMLEHTKDMQLVCAAALKWNANLIIASTSEVYGNSTEPLTEEMALDVGPTQSARSGYAVTKLYDEHLALAYHRQRGLRTVIARLFNVAGPRQRERGGCVVPILINQARRGDSLTIHGDGSQVRCFTHVDDTVSALIKLAETPEANGQIVNVGSDHPRTIETVAHDLGGHLHIAHGAPKPTYRHIPFAQTDPHADWARMRYRRPDVTKLEALTGLRFADRWTDIVRDTCVYWAGRNQSSVINKEEGAHA